MKTITIELSTDSISRAIKELERYQKEIMPKLQRVCERLAEVGRDEAQRFFDMAHEGNEGTRVTTKTLDNGCAVVAEGDSVYFVEFGTGDIIDDVTGTHGFSVSIPVKSGSYSEANGGPYSVKGYWYYKRVRYTETPIYAPMFQAERKMREELPKIVKEVFG